MKKALIIAPHPDDEINLAGQLIIKLNKLCVESFVVYTTNGDSERKIGNKRIIEAINANKVLGIDEKHVFFLGYPNEWQGNTHIYNKHDEELLISKLGKTETNSVQNHPEFCFQKHKVHHKFSRSNFKKDFKEVIESLIPDYIIAPEFDSHPDHRAASLMFDEIMGELLKENPSYRPIILKKYIHEGVWYGPKDYYQMKPTKTKGPRIYSGCEHDLDSPCFTWNERLVIPADSETTTPLLGDNIIYHAAKKHKLTTAWYEMQRVLNTDMIYWIRPVANLMFNAKIEVSSGNAKYLNDNKRYDCDNVFDSKEPFANSSCFCWQPSDNDYLKEIKVIFNQLTFIDRICLYEDCNKSNHIKKIEVIGDGVKIGELELKRDGSQTEFICNKNSCFREIIFRVVAFCGIPGIAEIEIFNNLKKNFSKELFVTDSSKQHGKKKEVIKQMVEKIIMIVLFALKFKIRYEIRRLFGLNHKGRRKKNGNGSER